MLTRIFSNIAKLGAVFALVVGSQFACADVGGKWSFAVEVMGQSGNATVSIEQVSATAITGTYAGQLGNSDFEGTTAGEEVTFALVSDLGSITYKGSVQDNGTIKGTVDFAGQAEGSFVATKAN